MNSTSDDGNTTVNTDGVDTWNSIDLNFQNWTVQNGPYLPWSRRLIYLLTKAGDDCISVKGNTTNLYVNNATCYGSGAMPIGSIGQVPGMPDYVENILFENVVLYDSSNAAWIKTWQGENAAITGNGDSGGGGGGYAKNVTWRNFVFSNVDLPIYVTQCIYGGNPAVCDTSMVCKPCAAIHGLAPTLNRSNCLTSLGKTSPVPHVMTSPHPFTAPQKHHVLASNSLMSTSHLSMRAWVSRAHQ